eukprot:4652019-Pyramimonas_sp.AAC.1
MHKNARSLSDDRIDEATIELRTAHWDMILPSETWRTAGGHGWHDHPTELGCLRIDGEGTHTHTHINFKQSAT